jgi:hypothetical protein
MRCVVFVLLLVSCADKYGCIKFAPTYEKIFIHEIKLDVTSGDNFEVVRESLVQHKASCVEWKTRGR